MIFFLAITKILKDYYSILELIYKSSVPTFLRKQQKEEFFLYLCVLQPSLSPKIQCLLHNFLSTVPNKSLKHNFSNEFSYCYQKFEANFSCESEFSFVLLLYDRRCNSKQIQVIIVSGIHKFQNKCVTTRYSWHQILR